MAIGILFKEELKEYDFGEGHPFRGDRYQVFLNFLKQTLSENNYYQLLKAEEAGDADLLLICKQEYIDFVRKYYESVDSPRLTSFGLNQEAVKFLSRDNIPFSGAGKLEKAARLIIGQAKLACDLVWRGKFKKIISIGGGMHHAKPSYGEGFCIYNDVAFAGKYLIEKYGLERVLILDTDAHAGNGTMEYFYEEPKVLFIDLHQHPATLYPGAGFIEEIGGGKGRGFTINCPLLPGTGWDSYQYIFEELIFPLAEEFQPQIILRNGGSDPYWNDSLTQLGLLISDFRKIGRNVSQLAKICGGREIDMIGSGYNQEVIGPCWLSLIAGLIDTNIKIQEPEIVPEEYQKDFRYVDTKMMVDALKKQLRGYWSCLSN